MQKIAAQIAQQRGFPSPEYRDVIKQLKKTQIADDQVLEVYKDRKSTRLPSTTFFRSDAEDRRTDRPAARVPVAGLSRRDQAAQEDPDRRRPGARVLQRSEEHTPSLHDVLPI